MESSSFTELWALRLQRVDDPGHGGLKGFTTLPSFSKIADSSSSNLLGKPRLFFFPIGQNIVIQHYR
jgi:hypothetical protein